MRSWVGFDFKSSRELRPRGMTDGGLEAGTSLLEMIGIVLKKIES